MAFLVIIIVVLFICVIIAISQTNEKSARYKSLKESVTSKYGEPTKVIDDFGIGDNETVYVFENPQIIVVKGKEYNFDSLLDFSVNGGQSYKVLTSTSSVIGRGIVGGVLFGGVGTLVGAGTASKKANPNGTDYLICITTKDLSNPMIEYRTKSDTRANELISVLKIILNLQKNDMCAGGVEQVSLDNIADSKPSKDLNHNERSLSPSNAISDNLVIDSTNENSILKREIEQMCPDYNSDYTEKVNDRECNSHSYSISSKKLGIVLSITAWCCIIGIVIYLYRGDSSNKSSHSTDDESFIHNNTYIHSSASSTSDRSNDDEYWNSVARQKELEEMGYDGAANMERNARQEYMRGGGYHAPDGTPQVQFQGSGEQAEQLGQMDEMGW